MNAVFAPRPSALLQSARLLVFVALTIFSASSARAQANYAEAYTFSTLAGAAGAGRVDGIGANARFFYPLVATTDAAGNIYVADSANASVRLVTPAGVVSTIAFLPKGIGLDNFQPGNVAGIAVDAATNIYVANTTAHTILKVTLDGTVTTLAGLANNSGTNDGTNADARFFLPCGLTLDSATNLYVADSGNNSIREITPAGVVTTYAGLTGPGNAGSINAGTTNARFNNPTGVTMDSAGRIFVADNGNSLIRKIAPNGNVTTLAGFSGVTGTNDGIGTNALFFQPYGLAVDAADNVYVADTFNDTIRVVTFGGVVSTLAGMPGNFGSSDGTGSNALFGNPQGIAVDANTNIYVADTLNNALRKVTTAGVVNTLAGLADTAGDADGTGGDARFNFPFGICVDASTNIYIADSSNCTVRVLTASGVVGTLAGSPGVIGTNDGAGSNAQFNNPRGIDVDSAGNLYVCDTVNQTIRKITPAGVVSTIAGLPGVSGTNNGTGTSARFNGPFGIAVDNAQNLYVAELNSHTIRKITTNGTVTLLAGVPLQSGTNNGTGTSALFFKPAGITVDNATNLYVAEFGNNDIRKITPAGVVTTVAGLAGISGFKDGTNTGARFFNPIGIAVDTATNLYVADTDNDTVRKLSLSGTNWAVSAIGGVAGFFGSRDGAGNDVRLRFPHGIAVDTGGNLYVADSGNNTIRIGSFTQYGQANQIAYNQPPATGQLRVTLLPAQANGQWRFPWELTWRNSGTKAVNLTPGNYPVEFRSLPGWLAIPPSLTVTNPAVVFATGLSQVTNMYYPTVMPSNGDGTAGSLTVYLGANPPRNAGWRFLGDTTPFFHSNFTTNLLPGTYLIEFAGPFNGRATPPNASVQIFAGQPSLVSVTYPFASAPPGEVALPLPVDPASISDLADFPFGFNGQLQTDVGYGSGVVVQNNVVLTAAHVVFDDTTLEYVGGAYWFPQEEVPAYVPSPLIARGWYVLGGYASQRTNDLNSGTYGVDVSSPQSRNLDVAALYFLMAVASGGYGGYLPSDAVPNQWLTGDAEKMLVGYPIDGSQYGFTTITNGVMYVTGPESDELTLDPESVTNQQQIYTAPWFLSYPGNSGGPFYVEFNGYYYPAGIYLGTLNGQSVVRAIDSNVTNLITLAATLGDGGINKTGGGIITIIPNLTISAFNPGYLQIQLAPPSAVQAGAAWLLQPGVSYSTATNFTQVIFSTNAVALSFKPIPGWNLPTNQSVFVLPGSISYPTAFYTVTNPVLVVNAQGIGLQGTTNTTYRIESTTSLKNPLWTGLSTNTIISTGFNLVVPKPTNSPLYSIAQSGSIVRCRFKLGRLKPCPSITAPL